MKLIRILGIVAVLCTASMQGIAQTTNSPLLVAKSLFAPTISWSDVTTAGNTKTFHYVATFSANYQAVNGDVTLGLPSAALPAIAVIAGTGSVSIYKNGVADPVSNYSVSVSYSQPTNTTAGTDSTFTIAQNGSTNSTIVISFDVANPGTDTYGVKLNRIFWTSANGKDVTELGSEWSTPFTSLANGDGVVPDQIKALYSKAALGAYLAATAKQLHAQIWSAAQVGTSQPQQIDLKNGASEAAINAGLASIRLPIELSTANTDVYYTIYTTNSDGLATLSGSATQRPVTAKAGYALPTFSIDLDFNGSPLIPWTGITSASLQFRDNNGSVTWTQSLQVTSSGFYFPPNAAGNSILVVTDATGSHVYDLQNQVSVATEKLEASATASKAGTESVVDSDTLNLIPFTENGIGDNVLGEIRLTHDRTVSIAGMTSEGVKMIRLHFRKMDGNWVPIDQWYTANVLNGVVSLQLTTGDWQLIADWPDGAVVEPPYQDNTGKG